MHASDASVSNHIGIQKSHMCGDRASLTVHHIGSTRDVIHMQTCLPSDFAGLDISVSDAPLLRLGHMLSLHVFSASLPAPQLPSPACSLLQTSSPLSQDSTSVTQQAKYSETSHLTPFDTEA